MKDERFFFTFSIPYIIIQLLPCKPMYALNFITITITLQHTSSYMLAQNM